MTPRSLRLFVKKLQPKVGLAGYDVLFAYFVVEAKSKIISVDYRIRISQKCCQYLKGEGFFHFPIEETNDSYEEIYSEYLYYIPIGSVIEKSRKKNSGNMFLRFCDTENSNMKKNSLVSATL